VENRVKFKTMRQEFPKTVWGPEAKGDMIGPEWRELWIGKGGAKKVTGGRLRIPHDPEHATQSESSLCGKREKSADR
jgi:hypothetical protein